jgi:glycosyltransferase involved in cell wall biosynthesis
MKTYPKVSICITVYNKEKYIAQSIESAISQDYKNIEIVIHDNASTDGSVDVIKKYLSDNRIKFYRDEINSGMYYSFKTALDKATGEWVIFLNSDDYWIDKTFISQAVNRASKFGDIVAVCGGYKIIYENEANRICDLSDNTEGVVEGNELFLRGYEFWGPIAFEAMLIKTSILKDIDMTGSMTLAFDLDTFWKLCLRGNMYILRKPFLMFRSHESNSSGYDSINEFMNKIIYDATVPIISYNIALKDNLINKNILDKWLIKNIIILILGKWGWDKLDILNVAFEKVLVKKGFSKDLYSLKNIFERLKKINIIEKEINYSYEIDEDDIEKIDKRTSFLLKKYFQNDFVAEDIDYESALEKNKELKNKLMKIIKNDFELVGGFIYDVNIREGLTKIGVDKENVRDFFDIFIYSKIYIFLPDEYRFQNFINRGIGLIDQINGNKLDVYKIYDKNIDIFCKGMAITEKNKTTADKIFIGLVQNNQIKYFIETKIYGRTEVVNASDLSLNESYFYYFIIPADIILSGEYDIVTIVMRDGNALISDNRKKIIF